MSPAMHPDFSRSLTLLSLGAALVLAAGCNTTGTTAPAPASATAAASQPTSKTGDLRSLDYAGDQGAVVAIDHQISTAGQDPRKLAAISRQLLTVVRDPAATYAGRQAAAQRLSLFPATELLAPADRAALEAMLLDESQVNLARLVLDLVPGAEVDSLYLDALARAEGPARLAVVQSAGNRRISAAVPKLAGWIDDADAPLAAACIKALGRIGTIESLRALQAARQPDAAPIIEAELNAAATLGGSEAIAAFRDVLNRPAAPANLRAAALHELLFAEPSRAVPQISSTLAGHDPVAKPVVIEALVTLPAPDLVPALASQLPSLDAPTQSAVIDALAHRGDAQALPAITAAAQSNDPAVRSAAIRALGRLPGGPETARLLGRVAAGTNADDARVARLSLARLTGAGVADTVVAQATSGEASLRVVFLAAIADRYMADQIPLLLRTRADADAAVRVAALNALADIAPAATEPEVLDWAAAATDAAERTRALRALAAVTLRNPDAAARARPVAVAIEAAVPAVAVGLMPVLPRIGGPVAADCAGRLALRGDATVATAAVNALSRWDDGDGLSPLVTAAEKTANATVRAAAVQGAVRFVDRTRSLSSAELTSVVRQLVAITSDAPARTRLVYLLGRGSDAAALSLARKLQSEADLAGVAADAAQAIQSNQLGKPTVRGSGPQRMLPNLVDGKAATGWGCPATDDQWLELDFHAVRPVSRLTFLTNENSYPEHVEIFVTDDPKNPGPAVASADGSPNRTVVDLPKTAHGRYLIVRHTKARPDGWWWTSELQVD